MLDLKSNIDVVQDIAPAAKTATAHGGGADMAGYDQAVAIFDAGVITDGTHTPALEESDDNSTFTAVAAGDLIGAFAAVTSSSGGSAVQRVGYIGTKRYIRVTTTVSGATTGGVYGTVIVRGLARKLPLA